MVSLLLTSFFVNDCSLLPHIQQALKKIMTSYKKELFGRVQSCGSYMLSTACIPFMYLIVIKDFSLFDGNMILLVRHVEIPRKKTRGTSPPLSSSFILLLLSFLSPSPFSFPCPCPSPSFSFPSPSTSPFYFPSPSPFAFKFYHLPLPYLP